MQCNYNYRCHQRNISKYVSYSELQLYRELGFQSLEFWRWFRKLWDFFKFKTSGLPEYLFDLIPQNNNLYNSRFLEDVTTFYNRTDAFKYSFYHLAILEWNKLDRKIRHSLTLPTFRNSLLKIGRPAPKLVYNILNPNGL